MGKRRAGETPIRPAPRHLWWAGPFLLFLVLRLFAGDSYYLLGGDQVTFLELGRTFPKHQLYGHELYLLHPPLFGYTIGLLHLALPLVAAGLVAVLGFSCLNFFLLGKMAEFERIPRAAIMAGLLYVAVSRPGVAYDYHVARVSILVGLTALALLAFLRLLKEPTHKALILALAANVLCLMVSEQALALLPCEAILLWARGPVREWKRWAVLAAGTAAAALFWPLMRLHVYASHADYPAGIDGTIEFTRQAPWTAGIQPGFLPFTMAHRALFTQTSLSLSNLNPELWAKLPTDLLLLPAAAGALVVFALVVAAFLEPGSRKRSAQWLTMSALMLLPVGLGMYEWYGMAYIAPFALVVMEGAAVVLARLRISERAAVLGLGGVCAIAAVVWLAAPTPAPHNLLQPRGGANFLFSRPPLTRGATIAHLFDNLPRDTGIMAPQGLSPEILYLTDKRVVALPFDPGLLDRFIGEYRISYVVTSSEYLQPLASPTADQYAGHMVARYLFQHPERFRRIQAVTETYPAFYPPTAYYVFQIQR